MRAIRILAMASAMCTVAARARAQEALPFHQGQWGIQGDVVGGGGGLVRFVTPRTALVLDLQTYRTSERDEPGSSAPSKRLFTDAALSIGLRNHRLVAPRVVGTFGVALEANRGRTRYEYGGLTPSTYDRRSTGIGPVVSLGGQYLLTDRFAAGVGYRARFSWGREKETGSGNTGKTRNTIFTSGFAPLYVTFYF